MGRRVRHLNARDAGAVLVLDSRFIIGLRGTDKVSTWNDRSINANNAIQPSSTNRPSYEVNILNGNPAVLFNGSNNVMGFVSNISLGVLHTCIATLRPRGQTNSFNFGAVLHGGANTDPIFVSGSNLSSANVGYTAGTGGASIGSLNLSNGVIVATRRNNTSVNIVANRTAATGTLPVNPAAVIDRIGVRGITNLFYNGSIGQIIIYNSVISDTNWKRMNHSSAFSFKLPCI